MEYQDISYEVHDSIATITLNRPERMNSFSPQLLTSWSAAITNAAEDESVRVVVVTGAGRAFCAGADVKARAEENAILASDENWTPAMRRNSLRYSVQRVPQALQYLDKPYIAAINGAAVGAGMDMCSMADIRIASDQARFGMAYVNVGLIPGDGGAWMLPRLVGLQKALELIWSGDLFSAQEALDIGYVSRVVPHESLLDEVYAYASKLASGPADHDADGEAAGLPRPQHAVHGGARGGPGGDDRRPDLGRCGRGPEGLLGEAQAGLPGPLVCRSLRPRSVGGAAPHTPPSRRSVRCAPLGPPTRPSDFLLWGRSPHTPTRNARRRHKTVRLPPLAAEGGGEGRCAAARPARAGDDGRPVQGEGAAMPGVPLTLILFPGGRGSGCALGAVSRLPIRVGAWGRSPHRRESEGGWVGQSRVARSSRMGVRGAQPPADDTRVTSGSPLSLTLSRRGEREPEGAAAPGPLEGYSTGGGGP